MDVPCNYRVVAVAQGLLNRGPARRVDLVGIHPDWLVQKHEGPADLRMPLQNLSHPLLLRLAKAIGLAPRRVFRVQHQEQRVFVEKLVVRPAELGLPRLQHLGVGQVVVARGVEEGHVQLRQLRLELRPFNRDLGGIFGIPLDQVPHRHHEFGLQQVQLANCLRENSRPTPPRPVRHHRELKVAGRAIEGLAGPRIPVFDRDLQRGIGGRHGGRFGGLGRTLARRNSRQQGEPNRGQPGNTALHGTTPWSDRACATRGAAPTGRPANCRPDTGRPNRGHLSTEAAPENQAAFAGACAPQVAVIATASRAK